MNKDVAPFGSLHGKLISFGYRDTLLHHLELIAQFQLQTAAIACFFYCVLLIFLFSTPPDRYHSFRFYVTSNFISFQVIPHWISLHFGLFYIEFHISMLSYFHVFSHSAFLIPLFVEQLKFLSGAITSNYSLQLEIQIGLYKCLTFINLLGFRNNICIAWIFLLICGKIIA